MSPAAERFGSWVAAVACVLTLLSGCADKSAPAEPFVATDITGADFARNFRLVDHHGKTRTLADFKGKAVLLFFGYTHCPDVCLTTLSGLAMVQNRLGDDAARVQVLFVTLDPARDTPEKLANFVTYFHKDFTTFNTSLDVICLPNNKFEIEFQEGIGLNYASWEPKGNEITENQLHRYLRIYNQHPRSQDFLQHVGIFSDHIWECVYDSRVYILVERCNKEGSEKDCNDAIKDLGILL